MNIKCNSIVEFKIRKSLIIRIIFKKFRIILNDSPMRKFAYFVSSKEEIKKLW